LDNKALAWGVFTAVYFARGNVVGSVEVQDWNNLNVPLEYVLEWALKQESMIISELLSPSGPTIFPTPTPTATPVPLGMSRTNPMPRGLSVMTENGLVVSIISANNDAWTEIYAENRFNDPPSTGTRYRMFRLKVQNSSGDDNIIRTLSLYSSFSAVGSSAVLFKYGCGVIPNKLSVQLFNGGVTEGNICFEVPVEETGLVIFLNQGGNNYWLSADIP
jgi:hypothetical protein